MKIRYDHTININPEEDRIMMKTEFEALLGHVVSQEEYDVIEVVYGFYPSITDTQGKKQVVSLYKTFGFGIFTDLYPRAKKIAELESTISRLNADVGMKTMSLKSEIRAFATFKYPMAKLDDEVVQND